MTAGESPARRASGRLLGEVVRGQAPAAMTGLRPVLCVLQRSGCREHPHTGPGSGRGVGGSLPHAVRPWAASAPRQMRGMVAPRATPCPTGPWAGGVAVCEPQPDSPRSTQTAPLTAAGAPVSDRPFTRTGLLGFVGPVSSPAPGPAPRSLRGPSLPRPPCPQLGAALGVGPVSTCPQLPVAGSARVARAPTSARVCRTTWSSSWASWTG